MEFAKTGTSPSGRTDVWRVVPKQDPCHPIGLIKWHGPWRADAFYIYSRSDIIGTTGGWAGKATAKKVQDARIQAAGRAFLDACMTRRGSHMYIAGFLRWVAEYRCKGTPAEFEAIGYAKDLEKAIDQATGQKK